LCPGKALNLFESGSILQYFAQKHNQFIPEDPHLRQECLNWLYWQMGSVGPICGQFAHFFRYAPADKVETRNYCLARYGTQKSSLSTDSNMMQFTFSVISFFSVNVPQAWR